MDFYLTAIKIVLTAHIFVPIFLIEEVVGQTTKYDSRSSMDKELQGGVRGFCIETNIYGAKVCRTSMPDEQWKICCARDVGECCPCPEHIWNCWYLWVGLVIGLLFLIVIFSCVFCRRHISASTLSKYVSSCCRRTERTSSRPENDTMLR